MNLAGSSVTQCAVAHANFIITEMVDQNAQTVGSIYQNKRWLSPYSERGKTMGNTFEVWSWEKDEQGNYSYVQAYAGEDYQAAIATMHELKNTGIGCVKLEWR